MSAKTICAISLLLCFSLTGTSQQSVCTLKAAALPAAPELFGFKLGMTQVEVKVRVPQIAFARDDELGVSKVTINPDYNPEIDKSSFVGVRSISLDFLDGRVTSLWFGYDSSLKWHSVDDFMAGISKSLALPSAWEPWRGRGQRMRCTDFELTITYVGEGPSFRLLDKGAETILADRRETQQAEREAEPEGEDEPKSEATVTPVIADRKSKTYYPAGCEAKQKIEKIQLVIFESAAAAEKAGFKKSTLCP